MVKRKNLLFVISAPSGAGKTTIIEKLLKEIDGLILSISHTTRLPRNGEINGKDYYFITKKEFKNKIDQNEFAEWNEYQGQYYGSSFENLENAKKQGKDLLFDIDINGAANIKKKFDNGTYIFILPPSISSLRERLLKRGAESREVIESRIKIAEKEIQHFKEYDYVVVNNKVSEASQKISSIIFAQRCNKVNLIMTGNNFTK